MKTKTIHWETKNEHLKTKLEHGNPNLTLLQVSTNLLRMRPGVHVRLRGSHGGGLRPRDDTEPWLC
jgi:hypothetical protein